jgi:hypothetical protein
VVSDHKSLANTFTDIMLNDVERLSMTNSASMVIEKNSGASELQVSAIINVLNEV